ncbi:MAG: type II toxin-antitoxin system RelE/ParE family toxin, partial [Syntrophaceae bacterium]|nr:type II toxin-antitoxin system RelE/ParE family toxin [Syntrophaceae bacterium]
SSWLLPFSCREQRFPERARLPALKKDIMEDDYGEPLRKTLKGYWKLRVGDYRVVFKIIDSEVWILGIRHRKSVYGDMDTRL